MFKNPHYATRGINAEIPLALQLILWKMIDEMEVARKDYLLFFYSVFRERRAEDRPRAGTAGLPQKVHLIQQLCRQCENLRYR